MLKCIKWNQSKSKRSDAEEAREKAFAVRDKREKYLRGDMTHEEALQFRVGEGCLDMSITVSSYDVDALRYHYRARGFSVQTTMIAGMGNYSRITLRISW